MDLYIAIIPLIAIIYFKDHEQNYWSLSSYAYD